VPTQRSRDKPDGVAAVTVRYVRAGSSNVNKRLRALALAVLLAGCHSSGGPAGDRSSTQGPAGPAASTPTWTDSIDDELPTVDLQSYASGVVPFGGQLMRDGLCWYLSTEWARRAMIFPNGFALAPSGDAVVTADGATLPSGSEISGTGFMALSPFDIGEPLWPEYLDRCANESDEVVFTQELAAVHRPTPSAAADLIGSMDASDLTQGGGCGGRFMRATEDGHVTLRVDPGFETGHSSRSVTLPDPLFDVYIEVGDFLLMNFCDDFIEDYEPWPLVAARFEAVEGHFDFPDTSYDRGGCDVESITITGLVVRTPVGEKRFDQPLEITNRSFGCLPG
jgi:hypothetical protein